MTRPGLLVTTIRPSGVQVSAVGAATLATTESVKPAGSRSPSARAGSPVGPAVVAAGFGTLSAAATSATTSSRRLLMTTPKVGWPGGYTAISVAEGRLREVRRLLDRDPQPPTVGACRS
jgi:hypothetical protein